jgi:1,5-anhydro-D-fructose reductase (1,5-anhydro-D-mannitol-forming)
METWRHLGDIRGVSDWDFAAAERADAVTITGAAGSIRFSMFENVPLELIRGGDILRRSIDHPVPIQLHHVEAMNAHLRNGPTHPSTGHSALRTAWATDTILRGPATEVAGIRLAGSD